MKTKKIRGKRYTAHKKLAPKVVMDIAKAIETVKKSSYSKYLGKIEAKVNLNIDPKESEHNLRFTLTLPHPIGNKKTVLAFGEFKATKFNMLDVVKADESFVTKLEKNELVPNKDFNIVVCETSFMPKLAKVARILGPKGLMPSPKNGLAGDINKILENLDKGQIEIRNQVDNKVVHLVLGKMDSKEADVIENFNEVIAEIKKRKPSKIKKAFINSVYLKATLGPSVKVSF